MNPFIDIWLYLSASPLLTLTLTLVAYQLAFLLYRKCKYNPLLNPVLVSVTMLVSILIFTKTSYKTYFDGAQFIHFLLGPATVALAIPLHAQMPKLRQVYKPMLVALIFSSFAAALSAVILAIILGVSRSTILSFAPKSVTTPIAMGIAEHTGGQASLTAVFVIFTGIIGAIIGPTILNFLKITNPISRGFGMGVASHGVGTARALQENEVAGAFSALAMGINGAFTAFTLPWLLTLISPWLPK